MKKIYEILAFVKVKNKEYPLSLFLVKNRKLAERILKQLEMEDKDSPIRYQLNEVEVITSYRQFKKLYSILEDEERKEVYTKIAEGIYGKSEGGDVNDNSI